MSKKRFLSKEEYTRMINEPDSDIDFTESEDSETDESQSDDSIYSDDTIITSGYEQPDNQMPSTSEASASVDSSSWSSVISNISPHTYTGVAGINYNIINTSANKEIDFFSAFLMTN